MYNPTYTVHVQICLFLLRKWQFLLCMFFVVDLQRLESELNTLMDLHQHGVTELREQLTQMERLTFSKNQDLEDTIENCQSRVSGKYVHVCMYSFEFS